MPLQGRCPLAPSTPDAPRRYLSTANHLPYRSRMTHPSGSGRDRSSVRRPVRRVTIPSDDSLFREHVRWWAERYPGDGPVELQGRLRRLFPRVLVRARDLSGEPPLWYVYGGWRLAAAIGCLVGVAAGGACGLHP